MGTWHLPSTWRRAAALTGLTLLTCTATGAQAGSIYLCKAYNGGTFWSSAHCRQHNALIDRIESVPDDLPFEQQVQLAEQSRAAAARLYEAPAAGGTTTTTTTTTTTRSHGTSGKASECKALEAQITQYEAMARQPQSGPAQDWIAAQKRKARDRQFHLRC